MPEQTNNPKILNSPAIPVRLFIVLGIAMTVYYSGLYYIFPALLDYVIGSTGWSKVEYSATLTIILVSSGLLAPLFGRGVDRGLGPLFLGLTGMLGGLGLFLCSLTSELWLFYASALLIGIASGAGLYPICFAFLRRLYGHGSVNIITVVTLFAGFASTITYPLVRFLAGEFGWPVPFQVYALALMLIGPLVLWATWGTDRAPARPKAKGQTSNFKPNGMLVFLLISMSLLYFSHSSIISQYVPLSQNLGISEFWSGLGIMMIGPMQVTGRLIFLIFKDKISTGNRYLMVLSFILVAISVLILRTIIPVDPMLLLFSLLQGIGLGTFSILRPQIIGETFGDHHVGQAGGAITMGVQLLTAFAPTLAALVGSHWGYQNLPISLIGLVALSMLSFLIFLQQRRNALLLAKSV
jgi:MFS family permease